MLQIGRHIGSVGGPHHPAVWKHQQSSPTGDNIGMFSTLLLVSYNLTLLDAFSCAEEDCLGVGTAAKRSRHYSGPIELPLPPQLPIPFPTFREGGAFHMRAPD